MRKIVGILVALAVLAWAGSAWAVNTVTRHGNCIRVAFDGSTAWDAAIDPVAQIPNGIKVKAIYVRSNAAADVFILRHSASGGNIVWQCKDQTNDGVFVHFPGGLFLKPYVVGNEVTASVIVFFYFDQL